MTRRVARATDLALAPVPGRTPPGASLWAAYCRLAGPAAAALVVFVLLRLALMAHEAAGIPGSVGIDYSGAMDGAHRWLAGDSPYLVRQLAGPYRTIGANLADSGEFLYPPVTLLLFAPFTILPAVLWWAVPLALTFAGLYRLRPARWSWPILALLASVGQSVPLVIAGNPTIWVVAAAIWAPATGWPGPLVLLKPSVAPFALLGITRRSWWIAAGLLTLACIPFGSLWVDWLHTIVNMQASGPEKVAYSLGQLPTLLVPLVAVLARRGRTAQ